MPEEHFLPTPKIQSAFQVFLGVLWLLWSLKIRLSPPEDVHILLQRANLAVAGILLNLLYGCYTFPKAMQPKYFIILKPDFLNATHRLLLPSQSSLWDFGRFPKSLLTPQTKLFFVLLNISYKWHSILLLSLLTTELVPPQPRDQALHAHKLRALFCVLLLRFFFSPFWKRKHADYTAF